MVSKKVIVLSTQIILILLSVLVTAFLISIPYEASLLNVNVPTSASQYSYKISNNTLEIITNATLVNNGIYALSDLSIFISIFTPSGFQIANSYEGYPYQTIVINPHSSYTLPIKIPVNIASILNTNVINEILQDKKIKLNVYASGRYAFNIFSFSLNITQIIPFQLPVQNITIDTSSLLNLSSWVVNSSGIFIPLKVFYVGTISLNNIQILGNVQNESNYNLFNLSSFIPVLNPGSNNVILKLVPSKSAFLELFSHNEKLTINLQILTNLIKLTKLFTYYWKNPISLTVEDLGLTPIVNNKASMFGTFYINNTSDFNIQIKGLLEVYNNSTNSVINQTSIDLTINANSITKEQINLILNNIGHGQVITFLFFITYPINLSSPLFKQTFVLP